MTKFKNKSHKIILVFLVFLAVFVVFELKAKKQDSCESMVDDFVKQGIEKMKDRNQWNIVKSFCYQSILKSGEYKELYAYYRFYKYADKINSKYNQVNNINKDLAPNNIYHWMLFYANQNSRDFDEKTQSFKKEKGLYEQELKDFEDQMTQEEKIKSFSYIADNLAAGKEGWVKKNDYEKSFEYLKRAAEAGDVKSQIYLGYSYFTGLDWMKKIKVEKNYIDCYKWLYISTKHSEQKNYLINETYIALKDLSKVMSDLQIKEAKILGDIWLEQNKEFIKSYPLNIIQITDDEIKKEKEKTEKFIKDYKLN